MSVYLTSPLIGVQKVNISLASKPNKNSKARPEQTFEVGLEAAPKLSKEETLCLGDKYQITGEEVI